MDACSEYGRRSSLERARHIAPIRFPISPNVALGNLVTTSTLFSDMKIANADAGFFGGPSGEASGRASGESEQFCDDVVVVVVAGVIVVDVVVVVVAGVVVVDVVGVVVVVATASSITIAVVAWTLLTSTCSEASIWTTGLDKDPAVFAFLEMSIVNFAAFFFLFLASFLSSCRLEKKGLSPRFLRNALLRDILDCDERLCVSVLMSLSLYNFVLCLFSPP